MPHLHGANVGQYHHSMCAYILQVGVHYTSHVTRQTSHVTRHTSHVTRHTSRVTRHTSHVTRLTSQVILHSLHVRECITKMFAATSQPHCPTCRLDMPKKSIMTVPRKNRFTTDVHANWRSSAKINMLIQTVKGLDGQKCVIFSQCRCKQAVRWTTVWCVAADVFQQGLL